MLSCAQPPELPNCWCVSFVFERKFLPWCTCWWTKLLYLIPNRLLFNLSVFKLRYFFKELLLSNKFQINFAGGVVQNRTFPFNLTWLDGVSNCEKFAGGNWGGTLKIPSAHAHRFSLSLKKPLSKAIVLRRRRLQCYEYAMLQIILPLLLQSGLHIPYTDNATSPSPLPSMAWQSHLILCQLGLAVCELWER